MQGQDNTTILTMLVLGTYEILPLPLTHPCIHTYTLMSTLRRHPHRGLRSLPKVQYLQYPPDQGIALTTFSVAEPPLPLTVQHEI